MKRKIGLLAIILSVSLNIAFIAVWGMRTLCCPSKPCGPSACMKDNACKVSCPLYRDLGTSDEQWLIIEPMQNRYNAASQSVCKEVSDLRVEMIDMLAQKDVPRDSVRRKQDQMIEAQRKMQDLTVEHLLAEKQILTAAQSEKLFARMKRGDGCRAQGSMIGLGDGQGGCTQKMKQTGK